MFRHHFLIAIRNFQREKHSFLINLVGLATGLACALLIYLWVLDELNIDHFNQKNDQLYQVMKHSEGPDGSVHTFEWTPAPLAKAMLAEMPEVEQAVSTILHEDDVKGIIKFEEQQLKVTEQYASAAYFQMFDYPLKEGSKVQALQDKNVVVLSEDLAFKLFGRSDDLIGQTVEWEKEPFSGTYLVSGIFQKVAGNTTRHFDLVFNFDLALDKIPEMNQWTYGGPDTYVLLRPGTNPDHFNQKISTYLQEKSKEDYQSLFIRPFADRHLFDTYEDGQLTGGRIVYVRLFSIIALFILLIACINFMNLATAKATKKIKEVGVKKTIGADRKTLIAQYLSESVIIALMALTLAIVLVELLLPQFNIITDKQLALNWNVQLLLTILGITLLTGLLAGSYPALYLSKFQPAQVLKGQINQSFGALWARKGLVVFQFMVSVMLIVSVMVVYGQIQYIQSKNLGYEKDQILTFKREGALNHNQESFIAAAKQIPGIINMSAIRGDMLNNRTNTTGVSWPGRPEDFRVAFKYLMVNYDFIETMGIQVKEGRAFSRDYGEETGKIIFNETAIRDMGLEDPIGKTVRQWGEDKQIIGVVKDFHFESLYEDVKPCFIELNQKNINLVAKIKAGEEKETIAQLSEFYESFNNGLPFEFQFMDEDYERFYQSEQNVSILSQYFAGIAILISCLGLFGLAAFSAERRIKEIGVRKILGASATSIIVLLSKDFTRLVSLGILIAIPMSYFIARHWLNNFAFSIELSPWFFVTAGLLALIIAWLTVGLQTWRAASVNPVECLKTE